MPTFHDDDEGLTCPECRAWFKPKRFDQAYCSAACNKSAMSRELARARRIYRAVYHWRLNCRKGGGWGAMTWVCREVASWIREDVAAQRLPPPPHNTDANRGHERVKQGVAL